VRINASDVINIIEVMGKNGISYSIAKDVIIDLIKLED